MRKVIALPLALVALAFAGCGNSFTAAAAIVNGTRLSMDAVEKEIDTQLANPQVGGFAAEEPNARQIVARNVLQGLISRIIVRQEAEKLGIVITRAAIDAEVNELREAFGGQAGLDQKIQEQGWSQAEFLERVEDQAVYDALTAKLAPVTDERIRQEYNRNRADFREVRYRNILFKTERRPPARALQLANAAKARIDGGEAFGAVARDVSEDEATKEFGGEQRGFVRIGAIEAQDQALAAALGRARLNTLTGPVRTIAGYHLLFVTVRRVQPLREAGREIAEQLRATLGQQAVNEVLQKGLKEAKVVVNPRYGEWDPESAQIVEHAFFKPPTVDENRPAPAPTAQTGPAQTGP